MLTFADIVAASTVKTWSDSAVDRGRGRRAVDADDSSSSSDGSTATATTVRTVITKTVPVCESEDRQSTPSSGNSVTEAPPPPPATRKPAASSTPRSTSRPVAARVRQLTTATVPRARSVSQRRPPPSNASVSSVPAAASNVSSRSQSKQ